MKIYLILLFIYIPCSVSAQKKQGQELIDSLIKKLPEATDDTNKVILLDNLSFAYSKIDPDQGIKYGEQVEKLSGQLRWERGLAKAYAAIGINYEAKAEHAKALEYYTQAIALSERQGNKRGIAGNIANIGSVYMAQNDYPKALAYLFQSLKSYEELGDKSNISKILGNIGNIYLALKNYPKTFEYYNSALNICYELNDSACITRNLVNIAIIYDARGDYDKALEHHFKALKINERLGNKYNTQINMANIGYVYKHLKDYPKALDYQLKALALSQELGDKSNEAITLGNIGETYLSIANEKPTAFHTNSSPLVSSDKKANTLLAIKYLEKAIVICQSINFPGPQAEFSQYLSQAFTLSGNYKRAFESLSAYVRLSDSVFSIQKQLDLAHLETRRAIDLKDKDLLIKEKQIQINKLEVAKKRDERIIYLLSIAFLVLTMAFVLKRLHYLRKNNRNLSKENAESLNLLQEAQQLAKAGNWNIDLVTSKIFWSDTTRAIYGVDKNVELSFEMITALLHPDDKERVIGQIRKGRETGQKIETIHRIIKPDGQESVINAQVRFVLDSSGKVLRMYGVSHDITELSMIEETLRKSEASIKTIVNNTDIAYILVDSDLKIVSFNQPAFQFMQTVIHSSLAEGKAIAECFEGERRLFILNALEKVMSGQPVKYEVKHPAGNDGVKWYYAQYFPAFNDSNNVSGIIMALTDITERKESDQSTRELIERLQKRNHDMNQFAYIVSHNLRAHIAKISGLADLLAISKEDDEERDMLVEYIVGEVNSLDNIIHDINTIITSHDLVTSVKENVSFEEQLKSVKQVLDRQLEESNATITTDFPIENVCTVKAYLHSIIYNLVSNAIKYRSADVPLHIHLSTKQENDFICLTVSDNGIGIDLDKNGEKIFGLYKRFHRHHAKGRGLGLYMVKAQTEALEGLVSLESAVNKGTTFYIYLPEKTKDDETI